MDTGMDSLLLRIGTVVRDQFQEDLAKERQKSDVALKQVWDKLNAQGALLENVSRQDDRRRDGELLPRHVATVLCDFKTEIHNEIFASIAALRADLASAQNQYQNNLGDMKKERDDFRQHFSSTNDALRRDQECAHEAFVKLCKDFATHLKAYRQASEDTENKITQMNLEMVSLCESTKQVMTHLGHYLQSSPGLTNDAMAIQNDREVIGCHATNDVPNLSLPVAAGTSDRRERIFSDGSMHSDGSEHVSVSVRRGRSRGASEDAVVAPHPGSALPSDLREALRKLGDKVTDMMPASTTANSDATMSSDVKDATSLPANRDIEEGKGHVQVGQVADMQSILSRDMLRVPQSSPNMMTRTQRSESDVSNVTTLPGIPKRLYRTESDVSNVTTVPARRETETNSPDARRESESARTAESKSYSPSRLVPPMITFGDEGRSRTPALATRTNSRHGGHVTRAFTTVAPGLVLGSHKNLNTNASKFQVSLTSRSPPAPGGRYHGEDLAILQNKSAEAGTAAVRTADADDTHAEFNGRGLVAADKNAEADTAGEHRVLLETRRLPTAIKPTGQRTMSFNIASAERQMSAPSKISVAQSFHGEENMKTGHASPSVGIPGKVLMTGGSVNMPACSSSLRLGVGGVATDPTTARAVPAPGTQVVTTRATVPNTVSPRLHGTSPHLVPRDVASLVVPKLPLPLTRGRSPAPENGSQPPHALEGIQSPVMIPVTTQISGGAVSQPTSNHQEIPVTSQAARGNMSPIRPTLLSRSSQVSLPVGVAGSMIGCSIQVPAHMHVPVI